MPERISFEPDLQSLAIADQLAAKQGVSLDQIAAEAFAAYCDSVREAQRVELDEDSRGA
jgi:hypothetical protein